MRKLTLLTLLFFSASLCKDTHKVNGGILPYFVDAKGDAYFLLGQEPTGDWADFGGGKEKTDKDSRETALREASEETRDVFGKYYLYPHNLNSVLPNKYSKKYRKQSIAYLNSHVKKRFSHPKNYYDMYLAEIDFIPADAFLSAHRIPHDEKKNYAWVSANEFMDVVINAKDRYHCFYGKKKVRQPFYDILKHNNQEIRQLFTKQKKPIKHYPQPKKIKTTK